MRQSRTRKPKKPLVRENRDRVPPTKCNGATFGVLRLITKQKNEKDNSTVRLIQVNNYQLYNCKTFMHTDRQSRITRRQQTLLLKVLCGFQITWNSFEMLCLILTFKH